MFLFLIQSLSLTVRYTLSTNWDDNMYFLKSDNSHDLS